MKEANAHMKVLIDAFPDNLKQALTIARSVNASNLAEQSFHNVLICGMGGSGIGGKIVSQWVADEVNIPILLCQNYLLPAFVNERTLVIASSYSGNTEETLIAVKAAHALGATVVGITSGGELLDFCQQNRCVFFKVPGGNPPRTALAFSLVQLVRIFEGARLYKKDGLASLEKAYELLNQNADKIHAQAQRMVELIGERIPVFYGDAQYEGVTVRAKQQFNENAKLLCWQHVIPEMNHNELVGWGGGSDRFAAIYLNAGDNHERNERRFDISKERTASKTKYSEEFSALGDDLIQRSLYFINLVDWASWYHAVKYGVDSIEIEIIDHLKSELSKMP